jgi:SNF2 family DNA or RNA helicase
VDIIKDFKNGPSPVLIISYDLCVRNAELLQECRCDLLVCDEGHKLKNKNIKIYTALKGIKTPRKIILSGTPLQNNLDGNNFQLILEFFCVVDFINPGLLVGGDAHAFTNLFTNPIAKSREPNASKNDVKVGREREKALNDLTNLFILRRTNKLLTKLLPPKSKNLTFLFLEDLIIFCGMSDLQKKLYNHVLKSKTLREMLYDDSRSNNNTLSLIQNLKKLLTHPNMIYRQIKV